MGYPVLPITTITSGASRSICRSMNFRLAPVGRSVVEKLLFGDVGGGKFRYGQRVKILLQNAPLNVLERAARYMERPFLAVFLADGLFCIVLILAVAVLVERRNLHADCLRNGEYILIGFHAVTSFPFGNTKHSNDSELNSYSRSEL